MQKQAMLQKTKINEAFEKMKYKGKMDPNIMEKLGITTSQAHSSIDANNQGFGGNRSTSGSTNVRFNNNKTQSVVPARNIHEGINASIDGGDYNNRSAVRPPVIKKKRPRSPKSQKGPSMALGGIDILKSKKEMDLLRKRFNEELLQVLEEEQNKENERERQI
jgi:hypothetical protein